MKEEIIQKIKDGKFRMVNFYLYPTYPKGELIIRQYYAALHNNEYHDFEFSLKFRQIFNDLKNNYGYKPDNKTGVKLIVEGVTEPVFLCNFDNYQILSWEINPESEPQPLQRMIWKDILKEIQKYMEDNPGIRFTQALTNLSINSFADPKNPETKGHLLRDPYNDGDEEVLERIRKPKYGE